MTRERRRKDRHGDECRLEMTPMIDVTFLLLIFFLCTLKLKTLEGKLETFLPKDVGVHLGQEIPSPKIDVVIEVVEPGRKVRRVAGGGTVPYTEADAAARRRHEFGPDRIVKYSVGPHTTTDVEVALQRAAELVEAFRGSGTKFKFTIDGRDGVLQREVVPFVDEAAWLGVEDVTFVGRASR